jgi:hypothetical protein
VGPTGGTPPGGDGTATGRAFVAGSTYFGANEYAEYAAGDLPVIVTAPHGGDLTPDAIPDRTAASCNDADFSAANDLATQPLARLIADSLRARTGRRAHLVIGRLARRKLDANRDSLAAACRSVAAGRAWHEFHTFVDSARAAVARTGAGPVRGLLVDVHGHAHPVARVELGYLLTGAQLDQPDAMLDGTIVPETASSIRTLSLLSPLPFSALLRGPTSLGALLVARGYAAVPSPADPGPRGASYFSGGYITERHGCADTGPVCAVQAELPLDGVRGTEGERQRFAGALADAVIAYLRAHGGLELAPR